MLLPLWAWAVHDTCTGPPPTFQWEAWEEEGGQERQRGDSQFCVRLRPWYIPLLSGYVRLPALTLRQIVVVFALYGSGCAAHAPQRGGSVGL